MSVPARVTKAKYTKSPIGLYVGNPLIEALPPILDPKKAFTALSLALPEPTEAERQLDPHLRVHALLTLKMLVRPLNDYLDFEPKFSMMLRAGYVARRPSPEHWSRVYRIATHRHTPDGSFPSIATSAYGILLYGLSGLGKSTLVSRILAGYPDAIVHVNFDGPKSRWTQIVFIKVNAPSNGSVVALCRSIIVEIARIVGDPNLAVFRVRPSVDELLKDIAALVLSYSVGAIVIDDLQHLNEANPGQKQTILGFLTNLIEMVGVPVLGIGTYSIEPLFKQAFKTARKTAGLGSHEFYRPTSINDPQWKDLTEFVWKYQWLRKPQQLTKKIRAELFIQAVGIPDVLVKLFLLSQMVAILSGKEEITVEMIRDIADRELRLLQPALNLLRKAVIGKLRTDEALRFDDLFPKGEWFDKSLDEAMRRGLGAPSSNDKGKSGQAADKKADASKPTSAAPSPVDVFDFRTLIGSNISSHESLKAAGLVVTSWQDVA